VAAVRAQKTIPHIEEWRLRRMATLAPFGVAPRFFAGARAEIMPGRSDYVVRFTFTDGGDDYASVPTAANIARALRRIGDDQEAAMIEAAVSEARGPGRNVIPFHRLH
jgi:hypothetical protein